LIVVLAGMPTIDFSNEELAALMAAARKAFDDDPFLRGRA
jgi:hypothetical protein